MNRTVLNGLVGFALAAYVALVIQRGKIAPFLTALSDEKPFAKYVAAFIVWKLIVYSTDGKVRNLVEASGDVAVVTLMVLGAKQNSDKLQKLSEGITKLIKI